MTKKKVSRRQFLGATATVTGTVGLAMESPLWASVQAGKLRWGIIGIGGRARAHISALNAVADAEITALCDIDPAHLEAGADRVEGPKPAAYADYRKLLGDPNVDAVAIVTPNHLHKQMTIDALQAGRHVLCEKPVGVSMAECNEVVAVARDAGSILQYGMQLRHNPTFVRVNELIQSGRIGNIRYAWISDFRPDIRSLFDDPVKERTENWRYFQDLTGGMMLEYSVHRLDLLNQWMNSKPRKLSCFGGHNVWMDRETIDHAGLLLEYANGARATYGMSLYSNGFRAPWLIIGDEGQMLIEPRSVTIRKGDVSNSMDSPRFPNSEETVTLPSGDGTQEQYEHFIRAARGEVSPYPDWRIAYDVMAVGVAAETAIQEGTVITL